MTIRMGDRLMHEFLSTVDYTPETRVRMRDAATGEERVWTLEELRTHGNLHLVLEAFNSEAMRDYPVDPEVETSVTAYIEEEERRFFADFIGNWNRYSDRSATDPGKPALEAVEILEDR